MTKERKLLIVDDNNEFRENIADIAELYAYQVITSPDAENAIELSKTHQPDVALLDVRLPGMDGFTACREIKQLCPRCSIIMMSAYAEEEMMEQALSECAVAAYKKPFDFDQLFTFIDNVS